MRCEGLVPLRRAFDHVIREHTELCEIVVMI